MKVSLKQLDQAFPALERLSRRAFPKDQHKIAYKLSRIYRSAKNEIEEMQLSLTDLMKGFGLTPGAMAHDPEKLANYRFSERQFLRGTEIELWGHPFHYSEIAEFIETPADLADLDWMILGGPEDSAELEKALTAQP